MYSLSQNNELSIGIYKFHFQDVISYPSLPTHADLFSLSFNKKVKNNIGITFQLTANRVEQLWGSTKHMTLESNFLDTTTIGMLEERLNYLFLDIGAKYNYEIKDKHHIYINSGLTIARGKNSYTDNVILYWPRPDHVVILEHARSFKRENYLGIFGELGYNYSIFTDRVLIGCNISGRKYSNKFPKSLWYGLQIGYQF